MRNNFNPSGVVTWGLFSLHPILCFDYNFLVVINVFVFCGGLHLSKKDALNELNPGIDQAAFWPSVSFKSIGRNQPSFFQKEIPLYS